MRTKLTELLRLGNDIAETLPCTEPYQKASFLRSIEEAIRVASAVLYQAAEANALVEENQGLREIERISVTPIVASPEGKHDA